MNFEITRDTFFAVSSDQLYSDLSSEAVLLNLKSGTYYGLNGVGSRIWQLIQHPRSVAQVCDVLLDEYDVSPDQCEEDAIRLLTALLEAGLVEIVSAP